MAIGSRQRVGGTYDRITIELDGCEINKVNTKVSETFSDRKFYLKHKLSTASLQSSTGKVIINYSTDIATGQWLCSYIRRIVYYHFTCRRLQTGSRKLVLQIKFTIRERFRNFIMNPGRASSIFKS